MKKQKTTKEGKPAIFTNISSALKIYFLKLKNTFLNPSYGNAKAMYFPPGL